MPWDRSIVFVLYSFFSQSFSAGWNIASLTSLFIWRLALWKKIFEFKVGFWGGSAKQSSLLSLHRIDTVGWKATSRWITCLCRLRSFWALLDSVLIVVFTIFLYRRHSISWSRVLIEQNISILWSRSRWRGRRTPPAILLKTTTETFDELAAALYEFSRFKGVEALFCDALVAVYALLSRFVAAAPGRTRSELLLCVDCVFICCEE